MVHNVIQYNEIMREYMFQGETTKIMLPISLHDSSCVVYG